MSREKPGADLGYWLQCLRVPDPSQRLHAATVLGLMGERAQGAVPALVDAMRDEDARVRRMVTVALGEIGPASRTAVPALAAALRDRHDAAAEVAALSAQARLSAVVVGAAPVASLALSLLADRRVAPTLVATAPGRACLATGVALEGLAGWWMRRILRWAA